MWVCLHGFFFAFVSFLGWNQAGRLSLCLMQKLGALRMRLCFAPEFRIALRSWGSCLLVKHLCLKKDCRNMSVMVGPLGVSMVQAWMISRAAYKARGQEAEWLASFLSFIILIASFLALRLRTFRPPSQ